MQEKPLTTQAMQITGIERVLYTKAGDIKLTDFLLNNHSENYVFIGKQCSNTEQVSSLK